MSAQGKADVLKFIKRYPIFRGRNWKVIKAKIFNKINQNKLRMEQ